MFRCSGRPGPRSTCHTGPDRVLAAQMGNHDAKYPCFAADGRRFKAVHQECGSETHYRICPRCHSQLPVRFEQRHPDDRAGRREGAGRRSI